MWHIAATSRSVAATSRLVCTAAATSHLFGARKRNWKRGNVNFFLQEWIFPVFMISIPQNSIFFLNSITILLVVTFHPEGEESLDCSGRLSFSTCSVAILNVFLRDHGKINDALSLVDLNIVAATCLRSVHAATRLLALILLLQYVAQIQASLNSCDRATDCSDKDFSRLTRRFVAATCRGDVSQWFVA